MDSLRKVKILLGENSTQHQSELFTRLESLGYDVTLANDVNSVLENLRSRQYKLIIIDHQLTGKDGLPVLDNIRSVQLQYYPVMTKSAITKNIKTADTPYKSALPVIAFSKMSFEQPAYNTGLGYDGYITVPYTDKRLKDVINEVLNNRAPAMENGDSTAIDKATTALKSEPLYDLSFINATGKEDAEFIKKLIGIFIEIMPLSMDELKLAVAQGNIVQVRKAAHKMKSSIDLLGINSIKDTVRKLEVIEEGNGALNEYTTKMEQTINQVIAQFSALP